MNVFIYFRDRPFFDAYLAPYLQSKIEKSFLDVWLTGGDVSRFLQPQFFDRLNAFERALLEVECPRKKVQPSNLG